MYRSIILALLLPLSAQAHEMVPSYPVLKPSYMQDVVVADMLLFNKRSDVEFYEIAVFDGEWNAIPFVSSYKIIRAKYLDRVKFAVYIRSSDAGRAEYVCSVSKLRAQAEVGTLVSSKICSKFKR